VVTRFATKDIYGEPLAGGHCEVHPWVHEEYPCGVCLADNHRHCSEQAEYDAWCEQQQDHYFAEMQMAEWVADDLGPVAFAGVAL
jgi:hypothetical protein